LSSNQRKIHTNLSVKAFLHEQSDKKVELLKLYVPSFSLFYHTLCFCFTTTDNFCFSYIQFRNRSCDLLLSYNI